MRFDFLAESWRSLDVLAMTKKNFILLKVEVQILLWGELGGAFMCVSLKVLLIS